MSKPTLVTTVRNTADALALMWESFNLYHDRHRWVVIDDASTDGAREYARANADVLIENASQVNFGRNLDTLARAVDSEYVLTVDSDVEFLGPVVGDMVELMAGGAFCVADTHTTGECQFAGYPLRGQKKIDHSCALFDTKMLQHILEHFSFEAYMSINNQQYFDGAAMVYRAARLLGHKVVETADIWKKAYHYGGISALFVPGVDPAALHNFRNRYRIIGERLAALRAGSHGTEGLTWAGDRWSCGY